MMMHRRLLTLFLACVLLVCVIAAPVHDVEHRARGFSSGSKGISSSGGKTSSSSSSGGGILSGLFGGKGSSSSKPPAEEEPAPAAPAKATATSGGGVGGFFSKLFGKGGSSTAAAPAKTTAAAAETSNAAITTPPVATTTAAPAASTKASESIASKTTASESTTTASSSTTSAASSSSSASSSATSSSATSSSSTDSCPLPSAKPTKGGKRAPSTAVSANCLPETFALTINGVTRELTKADDQGNTAVVYNVAGGWPDINGVTQQALVKTGKTPATTFTAEKNLLQKVDQLLADGVQDGREWLVIAKQSGAPLLFTSAFQKVIGTDQCADELKKKVDIVVSTAQRYVEQFGVFHKDLQPENVFWNDDATQATLIDWGTADEVPQTFTDQQRTAATQQATFSFRDSCNTANKIG